MNSQRGQGMIGELLGVVLLVVFVIIAARVASGADWNARNVRTVYQQCMQAAQTPEQQAACNPATPTPR